MTKSLYLRSRVFYLLGACILLFGVSYSFPFLFTTAKVVLVLVILVSAYDYYLLSKIAKQIECTRSVADVLSLGDPQHIEYSLSNKADRPIDCTVIDELPYQLQIRGEILSTSLEANQRVTQQFEISPNERGRYMFGNLNLFISNPMLGLIEYKLIIPDEHLSEVYPSIIQMKKYELQVFSRTAHLSGIRKTRRIGESNEFEHIRPFLQGDNIRSINWKATSRKNQLMINEYQNTKSQTIYCIVDKGRAMKMPFYDMTLLDHAINSTLVLSNIILKKYDKVGLITYSNKIGSIINPSTKRGQLELISNSLYNQSTDFKEPNFELLYYTVRRSISRRSILLMYTNFESLIDLDRSLPYLQGINQRHLLVLIIFINTEILEASQLTCQSKSDIYLKTFADKTLHEKEKIAQKLQTYGIQTILTKPEDLSINAINKYLEIKNKRAG